MVYVVPIHEGLLTPVDLNKDYIERPKDTKFMIVDDEGNNICEKDFAKVWLSNGLYVFGKVLNIKDVSVELLINGREKIHIPYLIVSCILSDKLSMKNY